MECFEEEPTLAQQFEFQLTTNKFDFPLLSDRQEQSQTKDDLDLQNQLSSRFEQSPAHSKEDQVLAEKCNEQQVQIQELMDKINQMEKDASNLR